MKKLLSPRGYLSWTQISMWQNSPERYIRQYMLGDKIEINNSGIEFGKKASEALESGELTDDELLNTVIALLPAYEAREHEITVDYDTKYGQVTLLGKLDTFGANPLRGREYKTGRTKWTQSKAQKHKQIHHYQTMIWLKHKALAEWYLDWIQTEEVDGVVGCTGHIESFPVNITLKDVLEYMALVTKVAVEIDAEYRRQLKNLT